MSEERITEETRRLSYQAILETLSKRKKQVLSSLKDFPEGTTAGELALSMWDKGHVPLPDRNSVHPRLHELVGLELVTIDGKRYCKVTGKLCSVYRLKED